MDSQQDWTLAAGKEEDGWTIVSFNRALQTGDTRDRDIVQVNTCMRLYMYMHTYVYAHDHVLEVCAGMHMLDCLHIYRLPAHDQRVVHSIWVAAKFWLQSVTTALQPTHH